MSHLFKIAAVLLFFFAGATPAMGLRELPEMGDKTLSMDLQDANLKDVLKVFSIQSGLNFIAAQNVEDRKITLYLDKVPIREGMKKLFEANNLTYDYDSVANIYVVKYWGEPQIELMTKIYRLRYRGVSSGTLEREKNALMAESGIGLEMRSTTASDSGEDDDEESDGTIKDTIKQVLSGEGKISEDKRTNSLIITDIPSRFPVIDELIARLDIPQPMIMLEVEMLDVSKNLMDKLGFDIGTLTAPNPLTLNFGKGFSFNDITASVVSPGSSATQGVVSFGRAQDFRYNALLDFLRQQTDTRFLARPKILTLNNETAEIGVVKDEVVNEKTTTTTSEGGTDTTTQEFERATSLKLTPEGIGVFLRVTPQVNVETNEITLVVNPKASSTSQSPYVPTTGANAKVALDPEVRMTKSIVKVRDGETIVIGGLIHRETQTTQRKVPILGDIPLLGMLFRHKSTDKDLDRELLVFITPRVVKEPGMLAKVEETTCALQYLSSGIKRKQEIDSLLDEYEEK